MSSDTHEHPLRGIQSTSNGPVTDFLNSISDTIRSYTETHVTGSAQPLMEYHESGNTEHSDDDHDHDGQLFDKRQPDITVWLTIKEILSASKLNGLLIFVLFGICTHLAAMNPLLVFTCNAIAIIPLSALLTDATERIAITAGDTIGALLNISFGNLVELILFIALINNQIYIVQASIFGSIIVNLLLILGSALVAGSAVDTDPVYNSSETQLLACLLFVSVFVVLMPTAFARTIEAPDGNKGPALQMSRVSALIVLMIYILYFAHEIKSRPICTETPDLEEGIVEGEDATHEPVTPNYPNLISPQPLHPRTIRFADEAEIADSSSNHMQGNDLAVGQNDVNPAGHDTQSELSFHRGRHPTGHSRNTSTFSVSSYHLPRRFNRFSRSLSRDSSRGFYSRDSSMSGDPRPLATLQFLMENRAEMEASVRSHPPAVNDSRRGKIACVVVLVVSSLLMSACGEFLVSTIDDVTKGSGMLSKPFVGLIVLPIVGNIAEYVTVVTVGVKGKLDLAIAVAVGSSIQISLCVTPLTVLAGWALQRNLGLTFSFFEMATLVGSVLLVNLLILNESSSTLRTAGLKGALMCACYVIFSMGAYLSP